MHGLPFKMRFRRSKLYISALLPLAIGAFVGILSAIMGVGGGFIIVPAMIYLLGMSRGRDLPVPDYFRNGKRDIFTVRANPDGRFSAGWSTAFRV